MTATTAKPPVLHPMVAILLEIGVERELTVKAAADALELSHDTVQRLVVDGKIAGSRHAGRGRVNQKAYRIPPAEVIKYKVRSTTGDRSLLLSEIAAHLPQFTQIAIEAAGALQPLPAGVIDARAKFNRKGKAAKDICPGHPDLFTTAGATA